MAQLRRLHAKNARTQALAILDTDIADFIGCTSWWDVFGLVGDPRAAAPNRLPATNGPPRSQPVCKLLLGDNVLRLGSFLTLGYFHGNFLSFFEGFESFHLDCTVVYENILSTFTLDKTKSLVIIEPFNGSGNSFA
jgi:hypothetical protein